MLGAQAGLDDAEDDEDVGGDAAETDAEVERLKRRFTQRRHEGIMKLRERASRRARDRTAAPGSGDEDVDVDVGAGGMGGGGGGGAPGARAAGDGGGAAPAAGAAAGDRAALDSMLNADYSVDPRTLKRGEYIVHEKIGIGVFDSIVGVAAGAAGDASGGQEYIVLRFQDGMAKLRL